MTQKLEQAWMKTFELLDKDGNGTLSKDEMYQALKNLGYGGQAAQAKVKKIMLHVDKNGDGDISKEEFLDFMRSLYLKK